MGQGAGSRLGCGLWDRLWVRAGAGAGREEPAVVRTLSRHQNRLAAGSGTGLALGRSTGWHWIPVRSHTGHQNWLASGTSLGWHWAPVWARTGHQLGLALGTSLRLPLGISLRLALGSSMGWHWVPVWTPVLADAGHQFRRELGITWGCGIQQQHRLALGTRTGEHQAPVWTCIWLRCRTGNRHQYGLALGTSTGWHWARCAQEAAGPCGVTPGPGDVPRPPGTRPPSC